MVGATSTESFKQFDVVIDYSDHHYYQFPESSNVLARCCFTNANSKVAKKITKEWKLLEENLPESIFVRAYEGRIDLLRAVIVGAPGTPYHDGLFFFDIAFPVNYPASPPLVRYHAHGVGLNPKLFFYGKVCLNLIKIGYVPSNIEWWVPSQSTILQLLVFIRENVLNAEPYYNDPENSRTSASASKSLEYNETAFTMSRRTMLYHLRKPPKNFEVLVSKHFRDNACKILEACQDYSEDRAVVGHLPVDGSSSPSSARFKGSMAKILEDLKAAFNENGTIAKTQDQKEAGDYDEDEPRQGKLLPLGKRKSTDCDQLDAEGSNETGPVPKRFKDLLLRIYHAIVPLPGPGSGNDSENDSGAMEEEKSTEPFKQFDVVSDYSDHHYHHGKSYMARFGRNNDDSFANASSEVAKKIMKEWKLLEENLPESIFVRAYEERIDLLRAVIIGAPGTPYHDGLFFFDIAFPFNYPASPPLVHYHAHGMRLNPNLYDNGKVCLSLVNTWNGQGNEMWVPSQSTILQVLVSIQGLVLNAEPYYNEPGYSRTSASVSRSLAYNENAFTLSCKTMLLHLRKPPKNFEGFVSKHFREKACTILEACQDYLEDRAVVGHFRVDGCSSSTSSPSEGKKKTRKSSVLFKESMANILEKLKAAFSKNGIIAKPVRKEVDDEQPPRQEKRSRGKRKLTDCDQVMSKGSDEVGGGSHGYLTRSKTGAIPKKSKAWDEYITN